MAKTTGLPRLADPVTTEWGGVLVLDLQSGEPLAQLPVHDEGVLFSAEGLRPQGSALSRTGLRTQANDTPLGWLDNDTVIVRPKNDVVAWDYKTGDLEQVTQNADRGWALSIASALIN